MKTLAALLFAVVCCSSSYGQINLGTLQKIEDEFANEKVKGTLFLQTWSSYEKEPTGMNAFKAASSFYYTWLDKRRMSRPVQNRLNEIYAESQHFKAVEVAKSKYPDSPYPFLVHAALVNVASPADWKNRKLDPGEYVRRPEDGRLVKVYNTSSSQSDNDPKIFKLLDQANRIEKTKLCVAMYLSFKIFAGERSKDNINNMLANMTTDTVFINRALYRYLDKNSYLLSDNNKKAVDAALAKFDRDWAGTHFGK